MKNRTIVGAAAAVAALAGLLAIASPAAAVRQEAKAQVSSEAQFEGQTIDLRDDWGDARACIVAPELETVECFASEAEMDERLVEAGLPYGDARDVDRGLASEVDLPEGIGGSFAAASCSSSVRLYDGTWYGGAVLYVSGRGYWHNLSNYGFNQRASSFKIGACSTYFADYNNGGGGWYPTSGSQAWDAAGSLGSWNNDISSMYIT